MTTDPLRQARLNRLADWAPDVVDEDEIRREYLAPIRGIVIGLLLCIPFWVLLGVVIGMEVS